MKNVRPELAITGKLLNRTALAPFGYEEAKIKHGENDDNSAGKLVVPRLSVETTNANKDLQGQERLKSETTSIKKTVNPKNQSNGTKWDGTTMEPQWVVRLAWTSISRTTTK